MKIYGFAYAVKNKPNQTQFLVSAVESTCSELACTEQGRSVEPISNVPLQKWVITRVDWFFAMMRGWRWIIGKGGLFYNVSFVLFPGISEGALLCSALLPGCARGCGSATLR